MKRFLATFLLLVAPALAQADPPPAGELFGAMSLPAPGAPQVFGSYAKGCLAGAVTLPADGDGYQAMRLSRNRTWGHPDLVAFIERLAQEGRADGWPGLLVGDMAQPRGGPMRSGHASHQLGLDVDLWLTPMPGQQLSPDDREELSAVSMLKPGTRELDPARFGMRQLAIIRRAALQPEVERIFVHPAIKGAMCEMAGTDRGWLRKVRPWFGHDAHFHVRLRCPAGQPDCRPQEPPPEGDGCGADLAWWFSEEPWQAPAVPEPPPKPLVLSDLPTQCTAVLSAP
ncbi:MAG TPA: penicillin-insensitive murein endopeptidase [Geminicoccus sp.]|jgi:penicillin-insensitive murein endopeptidase|uniref:penicillin-insensitive murein endopeptidase n=1 Tax=Geminicoccus sp. TaxID=2024832 RepID=UPI002E353B85|nr:penicillin-insensitive murein endopeptidase [Geminicoccus sp.]HEX2528636.1 penicillin-insensitive murein endopeptidase [Geminicoccus sp.]